LTGWRGVPRSLRKAVCTVRTCLTPHTTRAPSSAADLCRAYNRTCPSTSCQAPTCDPASGTCSAPTPLANGTLCANGSCLAGACTGEGWVCKRWAFPARLGQGEDPWRQRRSLPSRLTSHPSPIDRATLVGPPSMLAWTPCLPSRPTDLCAAGNVTCPSTSCQANRTCDPSSGSCSAPTPLANGTLCPVGSCLMGVCTGEAGVAGTRLVLFGLLGALVLQKKEGHWRARAATPGRLTSAPPPINQAGGRPPSLPPALLACRLSKTDLCVAGGVTCPSTSCQAPRTCDPATGTCSAPTPLANGTLCAKGSCLAGVCTGEGGFAGTCWSVSAFLGLWCHRMRRTVGATGVALSSRSTSHLSPSI
jgi:hypothetical protein